MDTSSDKIITDVLQKAKKGLFIWLNSIHIRIGCLMISEGGIQLSEKLRKLLVERQIPFIPATIDIEVLRSLGFGVFGIVELIRHQKKLYAHKRPRQNTSE